MDTHSVVHLDLDQIPWNAGGCGGIFPAFYPPPIESESCQYGLYEPPDSMNDTSSELRQVSRFSLPGLFFLLAACSIEAAAFIYGSPFWWLMSVAVLAMLVGASARGLGHVDSGRRAARIAIIVFGGVGFVHLSIARHPWTESWLLRHTWDEITAGSGWFTFNGASAVGIHYTLSWTAVAVMAGCVVGVVVAVATGRRQDQPSTWGLCGVALVCLGTTLMALLHHIGDEESVAGMVVLHIGVICGIMGWKSIYGKVAALGGYVTFIFLLYW